MQRFRKARTSEQQKKIIEDNRGCETKWRALSAKSLYLIVCDLNRFLTNKNPTEINILDKNDRRSYTPKCAGRDENRAYGQKQEG
ncbi:hypothetical protein QZH41_016155 [Actinostola sp. cb2023]|nr:hypothetical protein QZH41_016155 [Actinostola sp. cb2023]